MTKSSKNGSRGTRNTVAVEFANVISQLVRVPKSEIDAEEKKYKAARKRAKKTVKASQRKA
jgi:hypothetical protein